MPASSSSPSPATAAARTVRVWDLPTRLFHWGLAAAVVGLVVTAKTGAMDWHFRLGYAVMALLVFIVHVLVKALLLEHKDRASELKYFVKLMDGKFVKGF